MKPFRYSFRVTPSIDPTKFLLFGLSLLTLLLLWYLRYRPTLAPDLGFALATDENGKFEPRALGENSPIRILLALAEQKPIILQNGDNPIIWVCAINGELYRLKLAAGVVLQEIKPDTLDITPNGKYASIQVQTIYRLKTPKGNYLLRLEFH